MNRSLLSAMLILAAAFLWANDRSQAEVSAKRSTLTIAVRNYAQVDPKTLANGEQSATLIFRKAGVEAHWIDLTLTYRGPLSTSDARHIFGVQVDIIPAEMAGRLDYLNNVMGMAPGAERDRQLVYVFYDGLEALAERQRRARVDRRITRYASKSQILGALMAHELGHVLLDQRSHSSTGIMRGYWNLNDLEDVAFGCLLFTRSQADIVRAEVARRVRQRETVEVSEQLRTR